MGPEEWEAQDEWGALHIIVADGNVTDQDIEFCEAQPEITESERAFCRRLREFTEDDRADAWDLWVYGG